MRRMRNSLRALVHGSVAIAASVSLLLGVQARADVHARDALAQLAAQDIVWKSPGLNGAGSMPLGNGEFAANLWVEANGDIVAVLAHTDAFSEAERLLKLGRVRISCNPALATTPFVQRMSFADGAIYIDAGEGASAAHVRLFIESANDVLHATVESTMPRKIVARLENWRTQTHRLQGAELQSSWVMRDAPKSVVVEESADIVRTIEEAPDAVAWYHRNEHSIVSATLAHQGLGDFAIAFSDPLSMRMFGGQLEGTGRGEIAQAEVGAIGVRFERTAEREISSPGAVVHASIRVAAKCSQFDDVPEWLRQLDHTAMIADDDERAARETAAWWSDRFSRSWIFVDTDVDTDVDTGVDTRVDRVVSPTGSSVIDHEQPLRQRANLSQNLAAQRAVALAASGGEFPVEFNGSIFTTAPKVAGDGATNEDFNGAFNEDFRNDVGGYRWQRVRLSYQGMLARGDGDRMCALFNFYANAVLGCTVRAKEYHAVDGAYFPESMTTFATYGNGDYGWNREGIARNVVQRSSGQSTWSQGPELVAMMLDHFDHTGDQKMLTRKTLPTARAVLAYFDTRFPRDSAGKLVIESPSSIDPNQSGVVNDLPTVAGLREITARLCALGREFGSANERALWERIGAACPPLARTADGSKFASAEKCVSQPSNGENPELYAVWPFRLDDTLRAVGRQTFAQRSARTTSGCALDGMQAARLGLAAEAAANVLAKLDNSNANLRSLPDQCHDANLLTTVQEMLLQADGARIRVLPAWPKSWNARFRLHAPSLTVVTGEVKDGKLVWLEVDPPSRRADVVLGEGW